jgi:rhodanese-related sulfurtransferase
MKLKPFDQSGVPTVRVAKEDELSGLVLVDVRRPDEYVGELGHIEGAVLKTLGPELETFLATANKEADTVFICRSGARSANATLMAKELGFKSVYNMEGGMMYWNSVGLKVVR